MDVRHERDSPAGRPARPGDWTVSPWQVGMTSPARHRCPGAPEVRDPPADSDRRPHYPEEDLSKGNDYCEDLLRHPVGYGRGVGPTVIPERLTMLTYKIARVCRKCLFVSSRNEMGSRQGKPKQISRQAMMLENASELRISNHRVETRAFDSHASIRS
ncbi:PREDICTED: uncharacterized protein LOC109475431 [Branchiostoma belcheri]|uniref:Uncharacterized protein LOC109475431 n=1 Tax=Branchiostoma belcheri TaxID=7741 RepID=A0A6P4ZPJ7_BRABE|nr:PREDICTED: uncharacterized protein LOC109475431 [Branchiostoma belcheri]